jgi:hypothetical protein
VIRSSAILVAGALTVLITGVLATSLALVYVSIGVSALALVLLASCGGARSSSARRRPSAASLTGWLPRVRTWTPRR